MADIPTVGRIVHYVSYGSVGGKYTQECRAAIVTGVLATGQRLQIAVFNPTGMFFNEAEYQNAEVRAGGTWHWPERAPLP